MKSVVFEPLYYLLGSSQGGIATPRWDISLTQRERQIQSRCRRDWLILSSKIHSLIPMFSGSLGLRNIWTGIVVGSQKDTVIIMNPILLTHVYAGWKLTTQIEPLITCESLWWHFLFPKYPWRRAAFGSWFWCFQSHLWSWGLELCFVTSMTSGHPRSRWWNKQSARIQGRFLFKQMELHVLQCSY